MSADNGYFLYYDSNVVTDPTNWDAILTDCAAAGKKAGMVLASGWYNAGFFYESQTVIQQTRLQLVSLVLSFPVHGMQQQYRKHSVMDMRHAHFRLIHALATRFRWVLQLVTR